MPKMGLDWSELQACWEEVRDSGFFTEGKFTKLVEEEVEKRYDLHAVLVNSAGTGLYAMCRVLNVKNQIVVVQNNTFYATGAMPREAGAHITLVDNTLTDFSMECASLGSVPLGTYAVILTHVGGGIAGDYAKISQWCENHGAVLLEDAAHAFGASTNGVMAGHLSQGAVMSLYATKAIPVGEGGVIVTRDESFARALKEYRNYGKYQDNGTLKYRGRGFNFRMDEWSAAVAYLQIKRTDQIILRRNLVAESLKSVINPIIFYGQGDVVSNWYKYPVAKAFADDLKIKRFTGQVFAASDQLQAALDMKELTMSRYRFMSNSDWVAKNHVCLPLDEDLYDHWDKDRIMSYLRGGSLMPLNLSQDDLEKMDRRDKQDARDFYRCLKNYYWNKMPNWVCLEMFARDGSLHMCQYIGNVMLVDAWEIDMKWHDDLVAQGCRNVLTGICSYKRLEECDERYDFIVVDAPQCVYPIYTGDTKSEHFDLIYRLPKIMADPCVLQFYVNKQPYDAREIGSLGRDSYPTFDWDLWMQRRQAFYGSRETTEAKALTAYEEAFKTMGKRISKIIISPAHEGIGLPPSFRMAMELTNV